MIRAVIFDLDGTLVQTEKLKALSYARAAIALCPYSIEDSPSGVQAALAAGMWCIAVATPFTREHLHAGELLPSRWIVDDPDDLAEVVERMMDERGR